MKKVKRGFYPILFVLAALTMSSCTTIRLNPYDEYGQSTVTIGTTLE